MIKIYKNFFDGEFPVSQLFGKNPAMYKKFGMEGHNGIDYATPIGTPIRTAIEGTVEQVGYDKDGYGRFVTIENDHCTIIYGHLSKAIVTQGSNVEIGTLLGYTGNTGYSTGPHLHFGVRPKIFDLKNGFWGWIDPYGPIVKWIDPVTEIFEKEIEANSKAWHSLVATRTKLDIDMANLHVRNNRLRRILSSYITSH